MTTQELPEWSGTGLRHKKDYDQTGEMPWDNIWNFNLYPKSGVRRRLIVLWERYKQYQCAKCKAAHAAVEGDKKCLGD